MRTPDDATTAQIPAAACPAAEDDETAARYLFKLSRDVILSLDRYGNILCINQRGVELSGYSEVELRSANIFERLLLPQDRQAARQMIRAVAHEHRKPQRESRSIPRHSNG